MIQYPQPRQESQLLALWKEIFGDHDGFWELFLRTGYSPRRCRCLIRDENVAAALCWLDCHMDGRKYAYLYAVLTAPAYRHQGLCRRLMDDTHALLAGLGYDGVVLVPEKEGLRQMYGAMGYENATSVQTFACHSGDHPIPLRSVGPVEYASLRRRFLPEGGIIQEEENLLFLSAQAELFAGDTFLLAAWRDEDTLRGMELLGDPDAAPGILNTLGFPQGIFRCPGREIPFAMFRPLRHGAPIPTYFGLAFD